MVFYARKDKNECVDKYYFILNPVILIIALYLFLITSSIADEVGNFNVTGFSITGENPLSDDISEIFKPYIGQHSSLDSLYAAKEALENVLLENGYTFYRVSLPPQTLEGGIVKLNIKAFKVVEALVEGNVFFSDENIRASIPSLSPNKSLKVTDVSNNIALVNFNPSKSLALSFKASEVPGALSAVLSVKDTNPVSYFSLLNNEGTKETKLSRFSLGYQNNNLFDKDHSITLTYTTSPEDVNGIVQYGLNYKVPLYDHGAIISLLISSSTVDSGEVANGFQVKGSGNVFGLTYLRPLSRDRNYKHSFYLALNNSQFDNNVTVSGLPTGSDITSSPFTIGYDGGWVYPRNQFNYHIDVASNISGGRNNKDADYQAVRTGAKSDWRVIHYSMNYGHSFENKNSFNVRVQGQAASEPLISGEQFGIGGVATVRGYEERSVLGDYGYQLSLEYRLLPITDYRVSLFVFTDYAKVKRNNLQAGELESTDISSTGFGLNWSYKRNMSLKINAGYALKDVLPGSVSQIEKGDIKVHASLFYRY